MYLTYINEVKKVRSTKEAEIRMIVISILTAFDAW
jgi:hypothetical protein